MGRKRDFKIYFTGNDSGIILMVHGSKFAKKYDSVNTLANDVKTIIKGENPSTWISNEWSQYEKNTFSDSFGYSILNRADVEQKINISKAVPNFNEWIEVNINSQSNIKEFLTKLKD